MKTANLKNTVTNYVALLLVLLGIINAYVQANAGKPIDWGVLGGLLLSAVISYFTGKNPNGTVKSDEQIQAQNSQAK